MTEAGTKAVTHARVMKIALPIVLSNATVPLLGAVDTGVVGQLGLAAPIGAVGLGAVILPDQPRTSASRAGGLSVM